MSAARFRLMALEFKIRDFISPRDYVLNEVGLKQGFQVLDYGCGPGGYVFPACKLIGETGRLCALDINPVAISMVEKLVKKKGLKNVETILSDCATGLHPESIDTVLLFDVFHDLEGQKAVLEELHRVLKQNGVLSFSDHHLKEGDILSAVTKEKLFALMRKGERTYSFMKKARA